MMKDDEGVHINSKTACFVIHLLPGTLQGHCLIDTRHSCQDTQNATTAGQNMVQKQAMRPQHIAIAAPQASKTLSLQTSRSLPLNLQIL